MSDQLANDVEKRFRQALINANNELVRAGFKYAAEAMMIAGELVSRTPDEIRAQLAQYNIVTLPLEQRNLLIDMLSKEMADRIMQEAKRQAEADADRIWNHWPARLGLAVAVAGGLATIANQLDSLWIHIHG
jgi:hypothetical protein